MTLKIQLFAALAHAAGMKQMAVELRDDASVSDLLDHLRVAYPAWGPMLKMVSVAVNMEYATATESLHEGDEIALIPPVSGG